MPDGLITRLWTGLLATSPIEALAVLSSLVYVVLAVPRSRWCWVAGGVGSLIYVWPFARARLPTRGNWAEAVCAENIRWYSRKNAAVPSLPTQHCRRWLPR